MKYNCKKCSFYLEADYYHADAMIQILEHEDSHA
jgi:hypothetical protein